MIAFVSVQIFDYFSQVFSKEFSVALMLHEAVFYPLLGR